MPCIPHILHLGSFFPGISLQKNPKKQHTCVFWTLNIQVFRKICVALPSCEGGELTAPTAKKEINTPGIVFFFSLKNATSKSLKATVTEW